MVDTAKVIKLPFKDSKSYYNGLTDEMISERELALKADCKTRIEENLKRKPSYNKLQAKLVWCGIKQATNNS